MTSRRRRPCIIRAPGTGARQHGRGAWRGGNPRNDGGLYRDETAHGRRRSPYDGIGRLRAVPIPVADYGHGPARRAHRNPPPRHGGHAPPAEWRVGFLHRPPLGGGLLLGSRPVAPHPINSASEDGGTRTGTCHLAAEYGASPRIAASGGRSTLSKRAMSNG